MYSRFMQCLVAWLPPVNTLLDIYFKFLLLQNDLLCRSTSLSSSFDVREARNLSSTRATGCNIQSTAVVVSKVAKGNFICFRIILFLKTERAALLVYYFTVIYVIVALILSLIPCFESHEEVFVIQLARKCFVTP